MRIIKLYFCLVLFSVSTAYGQEEWKFQSDYKKDTSIFAVYLWQSVPEAHYAFGKLILNKSGRFTYSSKRPGTRNQYTEGVYFIKKDTLILNSDLQNENVKVRIEYIDTSITDEFHKKLSYPFNILQKPVYGGYYQINNDTSFHSIFIPEDFPGQKPLTDSIYRLKVKINYADFGSEWIPIIRNDKFIKVTLLTEKDFDEYTPKVLSNVRFIMKRRTIVEVGERL